MPRALVHGGLRGPGQDVFPEQAKQLGRDLGLTDKAVILKNEPVDDGAGATEPKWVVQSEPRARLDVGGIERSRGLIAEQINEGSKSFVSFDPGTEITTDNRVKIGGRLWAVLSVQEVSDPLIVRAEVKEVVGEH